MDLPIWPANTSRISWQEKFGITFNDWNRCHHIPSDLANFSNLHDAKQLLDGTDIPVTQETVAFYQKHALPDWPVIHSIQDYKALPLSIQAKIHTERLNLDHRRSASMLSLAARQFFENCRPGYLRAQDAIKKMRDLDIIVSPPPIKKQTLADKLMMIRNADQCLDRYNN